MDKSLCCLRLITLILCWFSGQVMTAAITMKTSTKLMKITNKMISSIDKGSECAWFLKVLDAKQQLLYSHFERLLFPTEYKGFDFNENIDYLSDTATYFRQENTNRSLLEVEFAKLISLNTNVQLIDHLAENVLNTPNDYEAERNRRMILLLPIFREVLYTSQGAELMCAHQVETKCRLVALIQRIKNDNIFRQKVYCEEQSNHCVIKSYYSEGPIVTQLHTFTDDIINNNFPPVVFPTLKLNNFTGQFEPWDDLTLWIAENVS